MADTQKRPTWASRTPAWASRTPDEPTNDKTTYTIFMYGSCNGTVESIDMTRNEYEILKCRLAEIRAITPCISPAVL